MSHQFHRAVQWEFQACCSSCQVNGEISQCMGASPVLKNTKDSSLVPQWMRWILYSVAGEIPGWAFGSALTVPVVFNFHNFSVLRLNLSGKTKKDLCNPKLPMITLVFNILCVLKQHTLISVHYIRFTPKEDITQNNLCEVWVSCVLETSLNCSSMKYVTCGAQSSFHNFLLTFLINCLAYRLLLSKCFWLTPSIDVLEREVCVSNLNNIILKCIKVNRDNALLFRTQMAMKLFINLFFI